MKLTSNDETRRGRHWPVAVYWAMTGVLFLAFEIYVLGRWITGPYFVPTDPGSDPISATTQFWEPILQIGSVLAMLACYWFWLIRPWMRAGEITSDGLMLLACAGLFFWDASMNYTSTTVLYNSHYFNRGSWYGPLFPGWNSPNGNLLPEPLPFVPAAYVCLIFVQVIFVSWLLRLAKARWPQMGTATAIVLIIVGMTIVDTFIEATCLRTEVLAYPAGIREVTLFAGKTYQFPLTEGFFFGGLGVGSLTMLRFFRDDKGMTWAEKGIETLRLAGARKKFLRFLAIYGFTHGMFFALWVVPNQWLGLKSDPYPEGLPSYLINNMCVYGPERNQCPGPGVMMPRPLNNPF